MEPSHLKQWRWNRALRYLELRKKIKLMKKNDEFFIKLTKKGKLDTLMIKLLKETPLKPEKWDGKWRLVIWDIPESSRLERNRLRNFFKTLGFHRLQKSVFIRPHPLPQTAVTYLREHNLLEYIRFLRVDKLDADQWLRDKFGLSKN